MGNYSRAKNRPEPVATVDTDAVRVGTRADAGHPGTAVEDPLGEPLP